VLLLCLLLFCASELQALQLLLQPAAKEREHDPVSTQQALHGFLAQGQDYKQ
jgi:hypothetical protein